MMDASPSIWIPGSILNDLCFEVHLRRRGPLFAVWNGEEPIEGMTTVARKVWGCNLVFFWEHNHAQCLSKLREN